MIKSVKKKSKGWKHEKKENKSKRIFKSVLDLEKEENSQIKKKDNQPTTVNRI